MIQRGRNMNIIKPKIYTRYPLLYVLIYNVTTIFHFLLGGAGIILGYHSWIGNVFGTLYILFAFFQMYVLMPLSVCPNSVYYRMDNSRCTSGLNLVSRKIAREGNLKDFQKRGKGLFCHNHLYMAALLIPIIGIIPALILDFTLIVLVILIQCVVNDLPVMGKSSTFMIFDVILP